MRIKSPDDGVTPQNFLTRDPKDPLPDPHEGTIMQNGHMKETALLADVRGQRLDSRNGSGQQQANGEAKVNGQNHVAAPTVIRTDHEMAVRTKVISVKRNIQPSNQDHRSKPPLTPSNSFNSKNKPPATTALHGQTRKQSTDEQTTPRTEPTPTLSEQFTFSDSSSPTSPMSSSAMSYNSQLDNGDVLEGMNGRHSSTSSTSMPYPVSPLPLQSPNYYNMNQSKLQRQMSSYERTMSADLDRLNGELAQASVSSAPKFIKDTSAYWYKPDITREQALAILRERSPGSFVVRDSRCFPGAFGLALKVDRLPPAVQPKPGLDLSNEYVRHFLIELSSKGVKLKGCPNEPVFGSLSALVYQHSITPLALPCKLIIPTEDQEVPPTPDSPNNNSETAAALELLKQGAACNVVYIGTMDMESLTGPMAIENAISKTVAEAKANPNKTSIVHFKVSPQGITLTDNQRKIFFRRHYPTATVTFCGLDPHGSGGKKQQARRWDATAVKGGPDAWMFGFVARKQIGSNDNQCHVFAELDSTQPARAIVNFVTKILIGSHRQNNA